MAFASDKVENFCRNFFAKRWIEEQQRSSLDPSLSDLPVLAKIVQALSDGLRLQSDCRVSAYVPKHYDERMLKKDHELVESVVVSRFAKGRGGSADDLQVVSSNKTKKFGLECNTERLDGLNWELMVVESEGRNAYYLGNWRIGLDTSMLYSFSSGAKLASPLAHEVGHGVAMHTSDYPIALWLFPLIPWPSAFWYPAALLHFLDLLCYCRRRSELEADYIGLMLMAFAGYNPRQVPHKLDEYLLELTHSSEEKRVEALTRPEVMDTVKIYEQIQAGHVVPSFV